MGALTSVASPAQAIAAPAPPKDVGYFKDAFSTWKDSYGKAYDTPEAELEALTQFAANDAIIEAHNARADTAFALGHNSFSDMSWEAFRDSHLSGLELREQVTPRVRVATEDATSVEDDLPESWDWEEKGCVTHVKDQGRCGRCGRWRPRSPACASLILPAPPCPAAQLLGL